MVECLHLRFNIMLNFIWKYKYIFYISIFLVFLNSCFSLLNPKIFFDTERILKYAHDIQIELKESFNDKNLLLLGLESDETISLAISPLVKKLKNVNILKKKFFDETIKCLSKKYSVECLQRGFLPFGPIQSVIYRMEDVQKLECIFESNLPIDADDLFSFNMALNRKYILFNFKPQITWDLTSGRFHASWTVIEEFTEQTKTIDALENKIKLEINYGLLSTYRLIHLLKYQNFNSSKEESFSKIFSYIVSFMNKKSTFFKIDKIFFIGLVNKIFNKKTEADDILHKLIIKKSLE